MQSLLALLDTHSFLSARMAFMPVTLGAMAAASLVFFRRPLGTLRPVASDEAESVMSLSKNGALRCICGAEHTGLEFEDRRQFCRSCGCEVVPQDRSQLTRELSKEEIRAMTRSLRHAAIRASHLELPPSITTIEELKRYLKTDEAKTPRIPPTRPTPISQPQVH